MRFWTKASVSGHDIGQMGGRNELMHKGTGSPVRLPVIRRVFRNRIVRNPSSPNAERESWRPWATMPSLPMPIPSTYLRPSDAWFSIRRRARLQTHCPIPSLPVKIWKKFLIPMQGGRVNDRWHTTILYFTSLVLRFANTATHFADLLMRSCSLC